MVGLVDYSSSEDEAPATDADDAEPRPRPPPPLPRAFHDLYAASVRTAPADLPALHQGRTRAIPHADGQWPSHLYAEWFPPPPLHARLAALLRALRDALPPAPALHSLLASDLGAPLPLHISLSRPFVLPTAAKADFLAGLVAAVARSNVRPFDVAFTALAWHRSPDAARAFLVLRVAVVPPAAAAAAAATATTHPSPAPPLNQPLVALLARCNAQVAAAGQPVLYAGGDNGPDSTSAATAFHMSIAWSLAAADVVADAAWTAATQQVFAAWQEEPAPAGGSSSSSSSSSGTATNRDLRVRIDSVKAKIGNVVTDIPLGGPAGRRPGGGLFGS